MGRDLRSNGNSPAQSKFDLINDWPLPATSTSLNSFIGLVTFYNVFIPMFELRLNPIWKLCRRHHKQAIPLSSWTPELQALFAEYKLMITSDPVLARCDSSMPINQSTQRLVAISATAYRLLMSLRPERNPVLTVKATDVPLRLS